MKKKTAQPATTVKFVDKDRYYQFQKAVLQGLDKYLSTEIENTPDGDIPF